MVDKNIVSHLLKSMLILKKSRYFTGFGCIFLILIFNVIAEGFIFRDEIQIIAHMGLTILGIMSLISSPFLSGNSRLKTYIGDISFNFNYLFSLPITVYDFLLVILIEVLIDTLIGALFLKVGISTNYNFLDIFTYCFVILLFIRILSFFSIVVAFKSRSQQWSKFDKKSFGTKIGEYYQIATGILFVVWIISDEKMHLFLAYILKYVSVSQIFIIFYFAMTSFFISHLIKHFNNDVKPSIKRNMINYYGVTTVIFIFSFYQLGGIQYLKIGKNDLISSILDGDSKRATLLINKHPELINQLSAKGNPPLYYAILENQNEIAKQLINANADIKFKRTDNLNLLQLAALRCNYEIVYILLEKGININEISNYKRNALFYSARGGCEGLSNYLIKKGISTDQRDIKNYDYKEYGSIENRNFKRNLPIYIKMGLLK